MKRTLVLTLGLIAAPAAAQAQVEVGLDAGVVVTWFDEFDDNVTLGKLPAEWARVAFTANERVLLETLLGFEHFNDADLSRNAILLMPGISYLLGEQFYVRGEVGLTRHSESDSGVDLSHTQYGFGGAAGLRMPIGDSALFRAEAGVDRWLEVTNGSVVSVSARTDIRAGVGISAIIT